MEVRLHLELMNGKSLERILYAIFVAAWRCAKSVLYIWQYTKQIYIDSQHLFSIDALIISALVIFEVDLKVLVFF